MKRHSKLHNLLMILLLLCALIGFVLGWLWHQFLGVYPLYLWSNTFCGGFFILLGGFLSLLPLSKQDEFIKDSFLEKLMNPKEKAGKIFTPRSRFFGLFFLLFGCVTIVSLYFGSK